MRTSYENGGWWREAFGDSLKTYIWARSIKITYPIKTTLLTAKSSFLIFLYLKKTEKPQVPRSESLSFPNRVLCSIYVMLHLWWTNMAALCACLHVPIIPCVYVSGLPIKLVLYRPLCLSDVSSHGAGRLGFAVLQCSSKVTSRPISL